MSRLRWLLSVAGVLLCITVGCSNTDSESLTAYGEEHRVELYSGGTKVREWYSTGKVLPGENGSGFFFKDADSGQLVRVMGDVVVTPLTKAEARNAKGKQQDSDPKWTGIPPEVDAGQAINGKPDQFENVEEDKSL